MKESILRTKGVGPLAIVITGIPFAPSHDAKVKLKREFSI